ncbi:MAG: hypothetical protein ACRDCE_21375, partial [Cetobacterium sp.]|uniref:hypothetical protein n=1 Tax=Cetobacterium sp. TaxID=2071632 RepID=UPI003EE746CE
TSEDPDVARTNIENVFTEKVQYLGGPTDTKRDTIVGFRNTKGAVYNAVLPTMPGEIVATEYKPVAGTENSDKDWDPTNTALETEVRTYLAVSRNRKGWVLIGRRLLKDLDMIDDGTNN